MELNMDEELENALEYGFKILETPELPAMPPTIAGYKQDHPKHRLFITSRGYRPEVSVEEEKFITYSLMAVATRLWGASEVVFVADTFLRRLPPGSKPEVLPGDDPLSTDALVASWYSQGHQRKTMLWEYHLDDEGHVVRGDKQVLADIGHEVEGRLNDIIEAVFSEAGEVIVGEATSLEIGISEFIEGLVRDGYVVLNADEHGAMGYAVGTEEELDVLKEALGKEGWQEHERKEIDDG